MLSDVATPAEPVGPVDATAVPRFAGPATFARLPRLDEVGRADVAVLGVPFDSGVSYRPGARFGPAHIRQSSRLLRPYNPALDVEPFAAQQVADAGDIAANPFDIEEAIAASRGRRRGRCCGRRDRLLTLGGDHTIALPLLRVDGADSTARSRCCTSTRTSTPGTPTSARRTRTARRSAAPRRRACSTRAVACTSGIRGPLYADTDLAETTRLGFAHVHLHGRTTGSGSTAWSSAIRARIGDGPVYVSVDIDVLDPAHAPGTGTPEAGGLTCRELLAILRGLAGLDVVGADIVEVAPAYDHAEITGIAASHVAYELLSVMARSGSDTASPVGGREGN